MADKLWKDCYASACQLAHLWRDFWSGRTEHTCNKLKRFVLNDKSKNVGSAMKTRSFGINLCQFINELLVGHGRQVVCCACQSGQHERQ